MRKNTLALTRFLLATITLGAAASNSAAPEIYRAVAFSEVVKEVAEFPNIVAITQKMVYRCPGCYRFEVQFAPGSSVSSIEVTTEQPFGSKKITVKKVVEPNDEG